MSEQQENTADDLGDYSLDDEDQLQPEDTLVQEDVDDSSTAGTRRPTSARGSLAHGVTAEEQHRDETIDERIRQEVPDPGVGLRRPGQRVGPGRRRAALGGDDPDAIAAEDDWLGDGEVGDVRAGRLVAPDGGSGVDDEKDLVGEDVGIDGAAASAEEAAVHVIDEPYDEDSDAE